MPWHVATVVTQIVVDKEDPAFLNPTKPPSGQFLSKRRGFKMMEKIRLCMKEDAGRETADGGVPKAHGYRGKDSILNLLDHEFIVVPAAEAGFLIL